MILLVVVAGNVATVAEVFTVSITADLVRGEDEDDVESMSASLVVAPTTTSMFAMVWIFSFRGFSNDHDGVVVDDDGAVDNN